MTDASDFDSPKSSAWLGGLVPVALVLGAAGLYWLLSGGNGGEGGSGAGSGSGAATASGKLEEGKTYYLFASEIELFPTDAENEAWHGGDSAPDVRYRILWQGNEVFESDKKENSLIADWSGLSVELDWSDLLGKSVSPDKVIKAARVRCEKGGRVELEVEDVDVASDDEAGSISLDLEELRVGRNVFEYEKNSLSAVRRIVLRALPVDSGVKDLVALMQ